MTYIYSIARKMKRVSILVNLKCMAYISVDDAAKKPQHRYRPLITASRASSPNVSICHLMCAQKVQLCSSKTITFVHYSNDAYQMRIVLWKILKISFKKSLCNEKISKMSESLLRILSIQNVTVILIFISLYFLFSFFYDAE